ncbi:MAG: sulfur carrier protein ThiS [Mogibacterium diversum]|nr:sulfur carrier protein ThiS [Mogibacterium diversum]MBF1338782.1 sulfur carrier protein ThiS [Mogibacterium diversum]
MIKVNGKEIEYTSGMTVQDLVTSLSYSASRIAVERLGEIVPKKNYADTLINDGDKIEIVCFMGGG